MKTNYIIGSVSSGTMREEDLIPCFLDAIAKFDKERSQSLTEEFESIDTDEDLDEFDKEDAKIEFLNEALFDALQEYALPYFYFGAHPGDGADFGFWLTEDFEQQFEDNGGLKVEDTSEVPEDYSGEVLHVSDHGNPTLYNADHGKLTEVWSLV